MKIHFLSCAAFFVSAATAHSADWPQWRGPERTGISAETGLLKSWPSAGSPSEVWRYTELGSGYSGPAVVGNRLFILGTEESKECVVALDASTGHKIWSSPIGPIFQNGYGNGPRSTPTVDGELIFALGGQSELVCLDRTSGKQRWHVNLRKNLGGEHMSGWGYTESPLVDGDRVICTPGGARGTMAALDKQTGKVIWRSTELVDPAAYSSIIVADVEGVRQYITLTGTAVVGVAASDGKLLWRYSKEGVYRTAVVPTAIYHDGHVYATAGYNAGCDLIKLTKSGNTFEATKVYSNRNMVNQHGGVILLGDYLYGYSDRDGWVCQEFKSGKVVWSDKRKLDKGSLTYADGHLYCYGQEDGAMVLVEASPRGWKEDGRFKIPKESNIRSDRGKVWTHPVVANGKLYLRDQDLLFAFDVKERTARAR